MSRGASRVFTPNDGLDKSSSLKIVMTTRSSAGGHPQARPTVRSPHRRGDHRQPASGAARRSLRTSKRLPVERLPVATGWAVGDPVDEITHRMVNHEGPTEQSTAECLVCALWVRVVYPNEGTKSPTAGRSELIGHLPSAEALQLPLLIRIIQRRTDLAQITEIGKW
jgi:hypothetical protein